MKTRTLPLRLLLALSLSALAYSPLAAGEATSVKLSSPDKPATLRITLPFADVHISGIDGDTITVNSSHKPKNPDASNTEGLRRLDDETAFDLTERDNIVSLSAVGDMPAAGIRDSAFTVTMPRAMALVIKTEIGGDLKVQSVTGDIEINNQNGEVQLEGIAGSTVVNTMNGEVRATYTKAPNKLIAITSMNGEINLLVPSSTKANVRLRTQNGSIFTDFKESALRTKSERTKTKKDRNNSATDIAPDSEPSLTGGKLVSGALNGGGADINISSMNGKITLRQTNASISSATTGNRVTVTFQDPDKFTDVADNFSIFTSTAYLDELRDYVQETAAPRLAAGYQLHVTFLDIDLAGNIRPDRHNIRLMTGASIPRAHLRFQLFDAEGQVLQEGERRLSDLNYQNNIGFIGRGEELYYDKKLLKDWITSEFKNGS